MSRSLDFLNFRGFFDQQLRDEENRLEWQTDPFRATALWENTVFHMENSIKPGRHTRGLKIYENCFRGAQAVACLSTYLNAVLPKTVSRAQVLILCQKLVMTGVMEDVKGKERTVFKEGRLYRFSKEHFWQHPPAGASAELDSSPSPTLSGCQSPTPPNTLTERRSMSQTPLVLSIKYPSDSIIAASSHIKHLFRKQSLYEPHSELQHQNTTAGQKLKKAKSFMLHRCTTKFRSDPPPDCGHHGKERAVKLLRRNAMRRERRPLKLTKIRDCQAFIEGTDEQGVYRATVPAQRSQSESYRMKDTITSTLGRKLTERRNLQTEKKDVAGIKGNGKKRTTATENDHVVKSYCIDTCLGHANKPKLFTTHVNPVSSVREDVQTAVPPAGMNWVVYGYL